MADSVKPSSATPDETPSAEAPPSAARQLLSRVIDGALWLAVIGVLALAVFPRQSGPNVGQPASQLELPAVGSDSGQVALPGKLERPLLIEAFASWCGACRRNAGLLSDLESAQNEGKLDVVAVSVDDSPMKALQAKRSWPIPVEVLHDNTGQFVRAYRVDVLPTYILIGVDGTVKRVTSGNPGAMDIRAWLNQD